MQEMSMRRSCSQATSSRSRRCGCTRCREDHLKRSRRNLKEENAKRTLHSLVNTYTLHRQCQSRRPATTLATPHCTGFYRMPDTPQTHTACSSEVARLRSSLMPSARENTASALLLWCSPLHGSRCLPFAQMLDQKRLLCCRHRW